MMLHKIYDFNNFKKLKDRDDLRKKILKITENVNYLNSIVDLKINFKKWIDINSDESNEKVHNG